MEHAGEDAVARELRPASHVADPVAPADGPADDVERLHRAGSAVSGAAVAGAGSGADPSAAAAAAIASTIGR